MATGKTVKDVSPHDFMKAYAFSSQAIWQEEDEEFDGEDERKKKNQQQEEQNKSSQSTINNLNLEMASRSSLHSIPPTTIESPPDSPSESRRQLRPSFSSSSTPREIEMGKFY